MSWAGLSDALSVTKDAPYEFMAGRNVFNLQPPLPPVPPLQPPPLKAVPKVMVTGVTDICGRRQVLAEVSEPGRPAIKLVLAEGEEAGPVQVLHIDVRCQVRLGQRPDSRQREHAGVAFSFRSRRSAASSPLKLCSQ